MCLNIKIATKRYVQNAQGLYSCPECNSTLGKVFNIHNDNLYTLQCPVNREHCYRKNNITEIEASAYATISNIQRCTICDAVLVHIKERQLICPNDETHIAPIPTTKSDIERLGYLPKN